MWLRLTPYATVLPSTVGVKRKRAPDRLCDDCLNLDLRRLSCIQLKDLQSARQRGIFIAHLKHVTFISQAMCELCRMFYKLAPPTRVTEGGMDLELRAFSFLQEHPTHPRHDCPPHMFTRDQACLAIVDTSEPGWSSASRSRRMLDHQFLGYMFCLNSLKNPAELFIPQKVYDKVNYRQVSRWMEFCNLRHKRLCGVEEIQPVDLKVIDCYTFSIVKAPPDCRYIALSYVWSPAQRSMAETNSSQLLHDGDKLPDTVSATVRDAILVTRNLGRRFLWVDKYCILQDRTKRRLSQILHMDSVYRYADLTIVAAAGDDEDFGLPGVGSTPRTKQFRATVQGLELICTMARPRSQIHKSKWWTRGWTLQEALISRRRLIFTLDQVYFECNAMNCCESMTADLDLLHVEQKDRFPHWLAAGLFSDHGKDLGSSLISNQSHSWQTSLSYAMLLIHIYTKRDLSYDHDILNAYAGVARHLTLGECPVAHLSGCPFPVLSEQNKNSACMVPGLLWTNINKLERRYGYPSWSWAGWHGRGSLNWVIENFDHVTPYWDKICFEYSSGQVKEAQQVLSSTDFNKAENRYPKGILFKAPFVAGEQGVWDDAVVGTGTAQGYGKIDAHFVEKLKSEQLLLILVATVKKNNDRTKHLVHAFFLIVEQHKDYVARTGILEIHGLPLRPNLSNLRTGNFRML